MRLARLPVSFLAAPALAALVLAWAASAARTATASKVPASHAVLPFLADDYDKALAEARARRVPLFIEAWAPW